MILSIGVSVVKIKTAIAPVLPIGYQSPPRDSNCPERLLNIHLPATAQPACFSSPTHRPLKATMESLKSPSCPASDRGTGSEDWAGRIPLGMSTILTIAIVHEPGQRIVSGMTLHSRRIF